MRASHLKWLPACGLAFLLPVLPVFAQTEDLPPLDNSIRLLQRAAADNPALVSAVSELIRDGIDRGTISLDPEPALLVVTYRQKNRQVHDVVVQLYQSLPSDLVPILNPHGTVRSRVGADIGDSTDGVLNLLSRPAAFLGSEANIHRQRRAFEATFGGDLTLLREQTVDPLHIVAIVPQAGRYLPGSLATRVRSLLLSAELNFGLWRGQVGLVTDDADDAEQVGNTVAAWRELAGSLAETYAGHASGRKLREALQATTVEVVDDQVLTTAEIPAMTAVRVAKEAAGHGGGCPSGGPCPANRVAVCHKEPGKPDRMLCVAPSAVPAHLAHGDYCGACLAPPPPPPPPTCPPGAPCAKDKVPICHKQAGKPDQTMCVTPSAVPSHLAHGDACGPCVAALSGNDGSVTSPGNSGKGK